MQGFYPINPARPTEDQYPFGADFFKRKFPHFIRQACHIRGSIVILELILSIGDSLDISHIEEIANDYLLVACFVDSRNCEELYKSYVRFDTIVKINVLEQSVDNRPIGFNVDHEPRVTSQEPEGDA